MNFSEILAMDRDTEIRKAQDKWVVENLGYTRLYSEEELVRATWDAAINWSKNFEEQYSDAVMELQYRRIRLTKLLRHEGLSDTELRKEADRRARDPNVKVPKINEKWPNQIIDEQV